MGKKSKMTRQQEEQFREMHASGQTTEEQRARGVQAKAPAQRQRKKGAAASKRPLRPLDEMVADNEWDEDLGLDDEDDKGRRDVRRARSQKARSQALEEFEEPQGRRDRD